MKSGPGKNIQMQTNPHDRGEQRRGEETRKRHSKTETGMERNLGGKTWVMQRLPCGT